MAAQSKLEALPVELFNQILSYLEQPRSRLPGFTERQSDHDCPKEEREAAKQKYSSPTTPPDIDRFAADLFALPSLRHPFNVLALTSRRCQHLVETYCAHFVKSSNKFNLPFAQLETYGPKAVYPDLSGIVYRRLFLQLAPRRCIYCAGCLSCYPHTSLKRVIAACEDCFYAQTYIPWEVQKFYHIDDIDDLATHNVRRTAFDAWILRIDVEALALKLYGTKEYHETHPDHETKPCHTCLAVGIPQRRTKDLRKRLREQSSAEDPLNQP